MSLVNNISGVIFGKDNINTVGLTGVDLWLSEQHKTKIKVSSNPIEDGSSITDNSYREPAKLTLTGYISNIELLTPEIPFLFGSVGYKSSQKVKSTWQRLKVLSENKNLLTVVTTVNTYDNMIISEIDSNDIDKNSGTALTFKLQLTEINIANTQEAQLPPKKVQGDDNIAKNKTTVINGGNRNSSEVTTPQSLANYII